MGTTLLLGAGFGGLAAANELKQLVGTQRIVVVDGGEGFRIGATNTWLMLGATGPEVATHSWAGLAAKGIEFVHARIESIDPDIRSVETDAGKLQGDQLVIALGADLNLRAMPGLAEAAHHFYSGGGAADLRDALAAFEGGRVVIVIPRTPYKCPAAPYEAALLLTEFLSKPGRKRPSTVSIHTVEGQPMPTGGTEVGKAVRDLLEGAEIGFFPQMKLERADATTRTLHFEGGEKVGYDLLIAVPPHEPHACVRHAGLLGPSGWVAVDSRTLETPGFENVFAVGDVNGVSLPGRYKPDVPLSMPKAGVMAEAEGRVVAGIIASRLGHGEAATFDGRGSCYLETGGGRALRAEGSFYEMPAPVMRPGVASEAELADKRRWVHETFARLL
ncbi:MAG: NAD(P)/FAD-dependent oxidoreductase [Fimbriimonas ginsengisoli]|uniref:NAD(P)/FAD-dependent oxidoreductase n=1 Tax=Fimbriimonas ginsengisoli TaxID=1005039 RepID=A0A931M0P7_FIMGI|nr:NAD(P)/FAD-dependent oxidoreductase [Fimbriimonas ginsengisoli]